MLSNQSHTLSLRSLISLPNRTNSDVMRKSQGKKGYIEDASTPTTSDGSHIGQKEKKTNRFEISSGSGILRKIR